MIVATVGEAAHSRWVIGSVLGKYRIVAELSTGGMGEVYRAQHEILGKPAAVKLLKPELTTNDELVDRFITEAKAASAIQHPGIVEIFDFGYTEDDRAYLVMELLDGEPLSRRIAKRGRHDNVQAAHIARGIAVALAAAHDKGIVHRDLKPDNVFLVADPDMPTGERPKVLDFGVAKLADPSTAHHTQTGVLMGTPLYMAPEQAREARGIDHRADLYSLGCILYELLVGEPPFVGVGAGEIIAMQMFETAERPRERVGTVSPALDDLVMRLLEKEPEARFGSAAEVASALGALIGDRVRASIQPPLREVKHSVTGAGTHHPLFVPTAAGVPAARRNPLPIVAAVLTLGVAAVAVFVLTRGEDAKPAANPALDPPIEEAKSDEPRPEQPAPVKTEPVKTEPVKTEVVKTEPAKPAPVKAPAVERDPPSPEPAPDPKTTVKGSPIELTP